ncbi:MAG: Asp-tRNA(Asn)/Glu-tRNA(Gln) amidotransferase subunit GatC [Bacilli bacterium]|nr:Asp-tRNA(Asn)/Glu-tRNA(Gln) amidotransferase subunit GatC [Bacilli bacterium]
MDKLSREEVLHVANLARIHLEEEEIEKFRVQLKKLMDDIDKIKDVKDYDEDMLISPVSYNSELRKDEEEEMLDYKVVMKNVPHSTGNFVEVPVMLNE